MQAIQLRNLSAGPGGVRPAGTVLQVGRDIAPAAAAHLVESRQATVASAETLRKLGLTPALERAAVVPDEAAAAGPEHLGGGWYQFPSGEKRRLSRAQLDEIMSVED